MAWKKRQPISAEEVRGLGLTHASSHGGNTYTTSANKRGIVEEGAFHTTGFVKKASGWHVIPYDTVNAGNFQRRPASEAIPYEQWHGRSDLFHDRRPGV